MQGIFSFLCELNGMPWKDPVHVSHLKNLSSNEVSKKLGWQGVLKKPRQIMHIACFVSVFKLLLYFKEAKTDFLDRQMSYVYVRKTTGNSNHWTPI